MISAGNEAFHFEKTGLDLSVEQISLIMVKPDTERYPRYELPAGYHFVPYSDSLMEPWADLQISVDHLDSREEALREFQDVCMAHRDDVSRMCAFLTADDGTLAGTAFFCDGDTFGDVRRRLHWVAVSPKHQNRHLCGVLLTKLMDDYTRLGCKTPIYMTTSTASYKAIGTYRKFGFEPYMGAAPANWIYTDKNRFEELNKRGWAIVEEKLMAYACR